MGWLGGLLSGIGSGLSSFLGGAVNIAKEALPAVISATPDLAKAYLGYKKAGKSQALSDSLAMSQMYQPEAPVETVYVPFPQPVRAQPTVILPPAKTGDNQIMLYGAVILGAMLLAGKR